MIRAIVVNKRLLNLSQPQFLQFKKMMPVQSVTIGGADQCAK